MSETLTLGSEKYASEMFFEITAKTMESIHWVYMIHSVHAPQKTNKILDKESGIRGVQNTCSEGMKAKKTGLLAQRNTLCALLNRLRLVARCSAALFLTLNTMPLACFTFPP